MNILYIDHYAGSPEMGMEFRPYYLSREWVKMGHKVTVIAGDYSHLRKNNPIVADDFQAESIDGIEYIWIKSGCYKGNGVNRALSMLCFVGKLWLNAEKIAKRWEPDVVIASSTYPLDTYPAQKIAKISGAKYIHEVHDMWPSTLYEIGGMPKWHPFVILMQIAENSAYNNCNRCVSLLPYAKAYMVKHGLQPEKFVDIQNGIVEDEWHEPETLPEQHKTFFENHKGQFIVGYFGGHSVSNALDRLLDVVKLYNETDTTKDTIFVLVGDGIEKQRLIKRAKDEHIDNLFFLPPINKKAIPSLLTCFDCSYMTGVPSPLYRFGLSLNKMCDSMMAGLPVICAFDVPDTLVNIYHCGYQCSFEISASVEAIIKLKSMTEEERKSMGLNGKNAILQHLTYEKLAVKFADLF